MMLGGVPMRVMRPPTMVANDKGIKVSAGLRLALAAAWMSTGMRRASAATLFITADKAAPMAAVTAMWRPMLRVPDSRRRVRRSMAPELVSPRDTIRTSAMITTAGWPKPENALSTGTTPATSAISSAVKATRS